MSIFTQVKNEANIHESKLKIFNTNEIVDFLEFYGFELLAPPFNISNELEEISYIRKINIF